MVDKNKENKDYSYESLRQQVRYLMNNHYEEFMKAFFATELDFILGLNQSNESVDESVADEIYYRFMHDEFSILDETSVTAGLKWLDEKKTI